MPLPVIAGTFGIVGIISTAVTQFMTMIAGLFTLKLACIVVFIGASIALAAGLVLSLYQIVDSLVVLLPAEALAFAAAIIPANMIVCISAVFAARTTRWVYDKNVNTIKRICG